MSVRSRLFGPPTPKMPTGLIELMDGLARDVLKNNPDNIYEYCALHMQKLLQIRDGSAPKPLITLDQKIAIAQNKVRQRAEQRQREYDAKYSGNPNEPREPLITNSSLGRDDSENLEEKEINKNVADVEAEPKKKTIDAEEKIENPTEFVPNELEYIEKKEIQKLHNVDDAEKQDVIVMAEENSHEDSNTEQKQDIDVIKDDKIDKKEIQIIHNDDNGERPQEIIVTVEEQGHKDCDAEQKQDVDVNEGDMIEKNEIQTFNNEVITEIQQDVIVTAEENAHIYGDPEQKRDISHDVGDIAQKQDIDVVGKKKYNNPTELIPTKVDLENSTNEIILNTYADEGVNQSDKDEKGAKDFNEIDTYERNGLKDENNTQYTINTKDSCEGTHDGEIPENKISEEIQSTRICPSVTVVDENNSESLPNEPFIDTTKNKKESIDEDTEKIQNNIESNLPDELKNEINCMHTKQNEDISTIEKADVTLDSDSHLDINREAKNEKNETVDDSFKCNSDFNTESTNNVTSNATVDLHQPYELRDEKNHDLSLDSEHPDLTSVQNNETDSVQSNALEAVDIIASESQNKEVSQNTEENLDTESALEPTHDKSNNINSSMDLETAAVTIQKVFRSFLFKTKTASYDDSTTVDISLLTQDKEKEDSEVLNVKDRRSLGISRMDTVLQTVNEEKSLSLSTDDSSTLSSAATIIQAHVRGFLVRNKYNLNKTISSNSLIDSDAPSIPSLEADSDVLKSKTVLNIHIVPEGGHFVSRDESILTSMDLSLDSSPPSSVNLHPLGYDKSERRKQLKREDAIRSVSPPSNNSGKLSEDHDSVKEVLKDVNNIKPVLNEKASIETQEILSKADHETINQESDNEKKNDPASDELDVITPLDDRSSRDSHNTSKLLHSGEFHDIVVPTNVTRSDTSVVRGE